MKHVFILNPAAGKKDRTGELRERIDGALGGRGLSYEIHITRYPGHAREIAREALSGGEEAVLYPVGGDGTINEAANGACGFPNGRLCPLPFGSGNDFVKSLGAGMTEDFEKRLPCSAAGAFWADVICSGEKISVNACSAGLDAMVAHRAARIKRFPLVTGRLAYLLAILYTLVTGGSYPMRVTVDGLLVGEGDFLIALAANGQYYGGVVHAVPEAVLDDGLLDFIFIRKAAKFKWPGILMRYLTGRHADIPEYIEHRRGKKLRIEAKNPIAFNFDGEIEFLTAQEFEVAAKRLPFCMLDGEKPQGGEIGQFRKNAKYLDNICKK